MNSNHNARPLRAVLSAATVLAIALGAGVAQAAPKEARTPYYVGVDLLSHAKHYADDGTTPTSNGFGLFAGYKFTDNLALEAGYTSMGKVEADDGKIYAKNHAIWLDGVARANVIGDLGVYVRAGIAQGKRHYDIGSDTKTGLKLGMGAGYAFNKNWGARIEANRYNMPSNGGFDKKVNHFTAAVTYQF